MNLPPRPTRSRILVVDDNQAIHSDFRKIFAASRGRSTRSAAEIALFGDSQLSSTSDVRIDSAYQGQQGLELVKRAREQGAPYAMAFVDVRMPPGWDGIETTARIWQLDPDIQIVICTAHSDYSWGEMLARLGRSDRLVILKKPFDTIEVRQLATALIEKWRLAQQARSILQDLERRVEERTADLLQARDDLQASAEQYRLLFDRNPQPMWVYDVGTRYFLAVNAAATAHYGYSEPQFLGMAVDDIRSQAEVRPRNDSLQVRHEQRGTFDVCRHRKADGSLIDVEVSADGIVFDGRPARLVLAHDVTARIEQEHKIARLSRIRAIIGGISSAMLRLSDRDELLQEACRVAATEGVFPVAWVSALDAQTDQFTIVAAHARDSESTTFLEFIAALPLPDTDRPAQRVRRTAQPLISNDLSVDPAAAPIREAFLSRGYRSAAAFPLLVKDQVIAVLALVAGETGFFDAEEIALIEWLAADLSFALEHIQSSQRLDHLAHYDSLTGLSNADMFQACLDELVKTASREQGSVCVVLLDLERFTQINVVLGRRIGDDLLRKVAGRLRQVLVGPDALCRIGADTFAVASPRDDGHIVTDLRDRILDALKLPFKLDAQEISISAQLGIALFPADGVDGSSVFKNAEAALKRVKPSGQRYAYHSNEMNALIAERQAHEAQLHTAVDAGQFVLHYQPRVDLTSGEVVGAEALIRWQHPTRGLLMPGEFITLAEETGLIVRIGTWVIDTVCALQAAWIARGIAVVPIAVNVSPLQFEDGNLLQTVSTALTAHALEARYLDLELTESAVMNDAKAAAQMLQALRTLGVGLALDDFGTGYSSLAHLKRFPFDSVKIDRSFVADVTSNAEDAAIATAIIAMAHSLGLKVVAEGVETQEQFNYLRKRGCDDMQGYFFSPAVAKETFESYLSGRKRALLPAAAPADQRTLLLVDDDRGIRAALNRVLRGDGYRILAATGGAEALELLALNPVQVIISDQRMPNMSGTEFFDAVTQRYPDTVRIILSGYVDLAVVTDSMNRGSVYKCLAKPWNDEQLRELVRDAFRRHWSEPVAAA